MKTLVIYCLLLLSYVPSVLGQSSQQLNDSDLENGNVFNQHTAVIRTEGSALFSSSVDIFASNPGNSWTYQQTIAPNECGVSSALDLEGNTLVIGEGCAPSNSFGRVNIYNRDASGIWALSQTLEQPAPGFAFQHFGRSVSISGDTLAVGANPGGESVEPAKLFLYGRNGNQWQLQTTLQTGEHSSDQFASQVDISGDTLLATLSLAGEPAVLVYNRDSDNSWTLRATELAEHFAIDGNTILLSRFQSEQNQSSLLFRTIDSEGQWTDQTIVRNDALVADINLHEGRAVSVESYEPVPPFDFRRAVSHYLRLSSGEWMYSGEIVPQNPSTDFISTVAINGNLVMTNTANFEAGPAYHTFITSISNDTSAECIDTAPVGDGWGWNGTASCRVLDDIVQLADVCVDVDGDGWGWDGEQSCVASTPDSAATPPVSNCIDFDGDGWGWDGTASCLVTDDALGGEVDYSLFPCVDEDGDGWGWQQPADQPELGRTCRVGG